MGSFIRKNRTQLFAIAAFVLAFGVGSSLVSNSYYQLICVLILIYATLGLAWNILSGYSGLVSFGHSAFFGLGAYTVAFMSIYLHVSPWLSIPIGTGVGALAGLLVGYPTFRLRGVFFGLAMLAYPLVILYIWEWLGFAEMAIPMQRDAPMTYMQFDDRRVYIMIALALTACALLLTLWVERSRLGIALLAIKQNEQAAQSAGINVFARKMQAIALSGGLAAAAGGLYAVVLLIVTPASVFGVIISSQALVVTLFGGVATLWGAVIGAVILVPLGEILHAELGSIIPGIQGVVYGSAIILTVLLAPEGLYWKIRDIFSKVDGSKNVIAPTPVVAAPSMTVAIRRPAGKTILRVENLSKAFGGLKAMTDVSFDVNEGEVLGIIGPNGAGKTTLFNLLNGFVVRDQGTVKFHGETLPVDRPDLVCRHGIGRTFQVVRPFPRMSVLDNVVVGAVATTSTLDEATEHAKTALHFVGLGDRLNKLAGGLTNIELRCLELARTLAARPRLILLDETLAGLGHAEVEVMISLIQRLRDSGTTVVIIEHTMHAMTRLADRFLVLDHGRKIAEGSPETVMKDARVMEAYLGKKWMNNVA